jgi:TPR repeat protein
MTKTSFAPTPAPRCALGLRGNVLALAQALILGTVPGQASATVTFAFEPPAIEAQALCALRAPDKDLIARWKAWDATSLEGMDPAIVQREIRRLRELDPVGWYDKIDAAITLLPTISPSFSTERAMVERIELMLAAGKLAELQTLGLVDQLRASAPNASPRIKLALSRYLRLGQGTVADPEQGMALLVDAAFGGNADALLEIVSLQQQGQEVPGWQTTPELAVTMAFGALVGQVDPLICDRVTRIASEYRNGDIVTRDIALSERWYRFAADLGDVDAAWKVAELHLRAEDLVKDNAVLVKYLALAAERGEPYMALAYGRLFEVGALVPKDLDRASEIYATAAESGDRGAQMRFAQFLATRLADRKDLTDPAARAAAEALFLQVQDALTTREDAPAWALVDLANRILATEGRWAGQSAAEAQLERAVAQDDGPARERLANLRLTPEADLPEFYVQVDQLIEAVRISGMIKPMDDLHDAFICRAPDAPRVEEAAYWREAERASGNSPIKYDYAQLVAIAADPDPQIVALLQTEALYGRAVGLAQYLIFLDLSNADPSQQEFWGDFAARYPMVNAAMGRIYAATGQPDLVAKARDLVAKAVANGDTSARLEYARLLLTGPETPTEADRAIAVDLLIPLAEAGNGTAMSLLPVADPQRFPDEVTVTKTFAAAIDARGDFEALVLALPHAGDKHSLYLTRATIDTECTFEQAATLMDALARTGDAPALDRWTRIAKALVEDDPWRMTALADRLLRLDPSDQTQAFAYYDAAWDAGFFTAGMRLLGHASHSNGARHDPGQAADLYADLARIADPGQLMSLLSRLRKDDPSIVALTKDRINPAELYLSAAEKGEPVAMREYGLILLDSAQTEDGTAEAASWLARASEAGDGQAMVEYAQLLALGVGVPASRDKALYWLAIAADKGIERAERLSNSLNADKVETQ